MPSLSFPFEPRCRYYSSLFVLRNPSKNKSILRDSKGKVNRDSKFSFPRFNVDVVGGPYGWYRDRFDPFRERAIRSMRRNSIFDSNNEKETLRVSIPRGMVSSLDAEI